MAHPESEGEQPTDPDDAPREGFPEVRARPDEVDLVRRMLEGDADTFRHLVDTYHATMLRVARAYVPGVGAAEEVVQETWMAILKGLPRFQGRSSLKTWMFRILTNRAKTRARREGRTIPMSAMGPLDKDGAPAVDPDRFDRGGMWTRRPTPWAGTPESLVADAQTRALIDQAIEQLPERQRLVVTLRDIKGWSSAEVCNVMEISETNQRVLLHRARSKVRAALDSYLRGER